MNPYHGAKNLARNDELRRKIEHSGYLPYFDPFSLSYGVHPNDAIRIHDWIVSKRHLYRYVYNTLASVPRGSSVRFADGLWLSRKELQQIVDDPEFEPAALAGAMPTMKTTRTTGVHPAYHEIDDSIENLDEFLETHHDDTENQGEDFYEWRDRVVATGKKAQSYLQTKIAHNMREMKAGTLKGGAGNHPHVTSRKQAIAISYAEARKHGGHYARKHGGKHHKK